MCSSVGVVNYDKFQWSRFYPQNRVYIHLFTEVEMKTVSEAVMGLCWQLALLCLFHALEDLTNCQTHI